MIPGSLIDAVLRAAGLEGHNDVTQMRLEPPNKLVIVKLKRNEHGKLYPAGDEPASETLTDAIDWRL